MRPPDFDRHRPRVGDPTEPAVDRPAATAETLLERLRLAMDALRPRRAGDLPLAEGPTAHETTGATPESTSLRALLLESGEHFPPHYRLQADEVAGELRRLLDGLARIGAFVLHTDHLDDSALYVYLTEHCLPVSFSRAEAAGAVHLLDLATGFDDAGESLFLKHYATTGELRDLEATTGRRVDHVEPPHDRDRRLPRPRGWRRRARRGRQCT